MFRACFTQVYDLTILFMYMLKHWRKCYAKNKARGARPSALFSYSMSKAMAGCTSQVTECKCFILLLSYDLLCNRVWFVPMCPIFVGPVTNRVSTL